MDSSTSNVKVKALLRYPSRASSFFDRKDRQETFPGNVDTSFSGEENDDKTFNIKNGNCKVECRIQCHNVLVNNDTIYLIYPGVARFTKLMYLPLFKSLFPVNIYDNKNLASPSFFHCN